MTNLKMTDLAMTDLELLQCFEPVVRYTHGELFFPCAVDGYLARCHLWMADTQRKMTLLAEPGDLTSEVLAQFHSVPIGHRLYLQFVDKPMTALDYQRWLLSSNRPVLANPSRLQRIGLTTRILDGLFDLTLLLRGRVPGGTTAAAQRKYAVMRVTDSRRVYYGRVIRTGGYIVLHYLFFFPMNDWRSSFHGVNDHESDWEQIFIYLVDDGVDDGESVPQPQWVAFASHDFSGDDLRRRWDDPEVEKVGENHPVIYAGAGSHASYFTKGEYLMQVEPAPLVPVRGLAAAIDRFWTNSLRQGTPLNLESAVRSLQSVPFVDYARGDGKAIGPGQEEGWTPLLISDDDGWVDGYRGLWGLDTWDPLGGERAPSGPKYNRDGSVRLSWRAPLAWVGLDKVYPPREAVAALDQLLHDLQQQEKELSQEIDTQREQVRRLELEVGSLRMTQFLSSVLAERERVLAEATTKLNGMLSQLNDLTESHEAGALQFTRLQAGDFGSPRSHIHHAHEPLPPIARVSRLASLWAAMSGGLILLIILAVTYFRPPQWPLWLLASAVIIGAIDAMSRDRLTTFLLHLTVILAIVTGIILLIRFWLPALVVTLALIVIITIRDNLREVWR
jgi:hypothetical protein